MNNNTKRPVKRIRVSLQDKVVALLRNKAGAHQVTFVFHDGTSIVQELKEAFLKGKKSYTVVADLQAIQHDLQAKYFIL